MPIYNSKCITVTTIIVATVLSSFAQCDADSNAAIYEITKTSNSLSQIATESVNSSVIEIYIDVELVRLTDNANFSHKLAICLNGNKNTVQCNINTGIVFESIQNVSIQNITIKNCGSLWPTSQKERKKYLSGLHIMLIDYITQQNITIAESNGSGINIYKPKYKVTISESYFIGNKLSSENGRVGGNGVRWWLLPITKAWNS